MMLSLQAMVRSSLMPETLSLPPAGGIDDADGPGPLDEPGGVPNVGETVGGELMIERTPGSWCAANAAMPAARPSTAMAMTAPRIYHVRLPGERCWGGPETGPPYVHGDVGG